MVDVFVIVEYVGRLCHLEFTTGEFSVGTSPSLEKSSSIWYSVTFVAGSSLDLLGVSLNLSSWL